MESSSTIALLETMGYRLVVLLALACVLRSVAGQLSAYFEPSLLASKQAEAKQYLKSPTNTQDAHAAAKFLTSTQQKVECDCNLLSTLTSVEEDQYARFYYGYKVMEMCKCDTSGVKAPSNIATGLKSTNMVEYASAALAAKVLGLASAPTGDAVVSKIKSYMMSSGKFKSVKSDKTSASMWKTKLALATLGEFAEGSPELVEVSEAVGKMLTDPENLQESDPTLLASMQLLTGQKPVLEKVKGQSNAARMLAITEGLVALRHSACMRVTQAVVDSLVLIMSYKSKPVHVALSQDSFALDKIAGKDLTTKVTVSDVFGKAISGATASAIVVKVGKDKEVFSGTAIGGALTIPAADMTAGKYSVNLSVIPGSESKKTIETSLTLAVTQAYEVLKVMAGVTKSKSTASEALDSVMKQDEWNNEEDVVAPGSFIHIAFTVSAPSQAGGRFKKPHQSFVRFTHKATGTSSFFVGLSEGAADAGMGHKYRATVSVGQEAETFYYLNGQYDVAVLVGDETMSAPEAFTVGSIVMEFPADLEKDKISPLYVKSLMDTSDNTLSPLPEIKHKMRDAPVNAPRVVSTLFTVLSLAPLAGFLGFIFLVEKPNLAYLFASPFAVLYAVGMGGTLVLYAAYWFMMPGADFYQTIYYLCAIAPILYFISRRGISAVVHERKMGAAKSKDE